jgi:hypothetical protein
MPDRFSSEILDLLDSAREIDLETAREEAAPHHRTTIWVLVDDQDRVLIRSVDGATARWYREAATNPDVVIHLRGQAIPASALVASDDERVESASREYRSKYGNNRSADAMVKPDIFSTTLELVPREAEG